MECRRGLAMRILSVCPSIRRVNCDKTEENSIQIFILYKRSFSLYFSEKKNSWRGATPSTWNFGLTGPRWSEVTDFEPILARSASAVTSSEKVQLTLILGTLRASSEPKMIIVRCPYVPKGGSKTKRPFSTKIALR